MKDQEMPNDPLSPRDRRAVYGQLLERDGDVALSWVFGSVWRYRQVIAAALLATAALYVLAASVALLLLPTERIATVPFRLLFEGAADNHYPDGAPFSTTEIVDASVLTEVYESNQLERFVPYDAFKSSVYVLRADPAVDLLAYEYQAQLADPKLTPADRARFEEDFRRRREALKDPIYSVNMRRFDRTTAMPAGLMQKVVSDVLEIWSTHARERRGAVRDPIPVLSTNLLQRDIIVREDYLPAIDMLRSTTNRFLTTIAELARAPGAHAIRSSDDSTTLAALQARLENVVRFQLEPLLDIVRAEGVTKNPRQLQLYASTQLFQLRLERERTTNLARALRASLGSYAARGANPAGARADGSIGPAAAMPQESFFDRLMALPTRAQDREYRQDLTDRIIAESERLAGLHREIAYYEDLVQSIRSMNAAPVESSATVTLVRTRMSEAFDEVARIVEGLSKIHSELSVRNLDVSSAVHELTGPLTVRSYPPLTLPTLVAYFVVLMVLGALIAPSACLLHDVLRRRSNRVAATDPVFT